MSSQLKLYPLPFTASQPPSSLCHGVQTESGCSNTAAFDTGLDSRDIFLGEARCVVCGYQNIVDHCHIICSSDNNVWKFLKESEWVPKGVKESPEHEPRNGIIMCPNHHRAFDNWHFFIRYQPTTKKYIFVLYNSYSESRDLKPFHGKAIALDIKEERAPLPLFFLVHEYMVRGRNFYQVTASIEVTDHWQDWVTSSGVLHEDQGALGSFTFNRNAPAPGPSSSPAGPSNMQITPHTTQTSGPPARTQSFIMPPTADLIEQLMVFQRTMPSWKAWEKESMSWDGTAENTRKYVEKFGDRDET